jgi:uncharacterized protein (TIGR02246 family)
MENGVMSSEHIHPKIGYQTPLAVVFALVELRNAGDIAGALSCYEEKAAVVTAPGRYATGKSAIRGALEYFVALHPSFTVTARHLIEAEAVCLHHSAWTLSGTDAGGASIALSGTTADVILKQQDGRWLIAIDNPWGSAFIA